MTSATAEAAPQALLQIVPAGAYTVSYPDEDTDTLAGRLATDGYLYVRGLAPRARLLRVRRDILELCRKHGWLKPGSDLMDGVFAARPFPEWNEDYLPLYRELIRLPSFNGLSQDPAIIGFYTRLLGGPILAHPRNIARVSFPRHYENTTQPHQDFWYIHGTPETYTTWIPVGDCPRELGGLAIQEGSHRAGPMTHEKTIGAGGYGANGQGRWLSNDYQLGDVVLFHSYTVHGALDNHTPDRLRISLDYRYQRDHLPVDPSSLLPHLT